MAHRLSDYIGGWEPDLDWVFGVESKPRELHRLWKSKANPFNFSYLGCGNNVGTNPGQPVANCVQATGRVAREWDGGAFPAKSHRIGQ